MSERRFELICPWRMSPMIHATFTIHGSLGRTSEESLLMATDTDDRTLPNIWEEFLERVFRPVYSVGGTFNDEQVGLLFLVLAVSVVMDPKKPVNHPDAVRFYRLSKISMTLGEVRPRNLPGLADVSSRIYSIRGPC